MILFEMYFIQGLKPPGPRWIFRYKFNFVPKNPSPTEDLWVHSGFFRLNPSQKWRWFPIQVWGFVNQKVLVVRGVVSRGKDLRLEVLPLWPNVGSPGPYVDEHKFCDTMDIKRSMWRHHGLPCFTALHKFDSFFFPTDWCHVHAVKRCTLSRILCLSQGKRQLNHGFESLKTDNKCHARPFTTVWLCFIAGRSRSPFIIILPFQSQDSNKLHLETF